MSQSPLLLGIDIGGTGTKAGVFDLDGNLIGSGYGEYQMISTLPGQAEHDAELWWQATIKAVKASLQAVDPSLIKAIGVGCTNGLIAVDRQAKPIRPAIMLWDQRALPEVQRISDRLGAENKARQQVRGRCTPGVVPVLVRLVFHVPGLPGDCGTALHHMSPAAVAVGSNQREGFLVTSVSK